MNERNFCNNMLDAINIISFIVALMNYNENIDQSTLQNTAKNVMNEIHEHLKEQDRKIDLILEELNKEGKHDGV